MNRKLFFKKLIVGAAAVASTPSIIESVKADTIKDYLPKETPITQEKFVGWYDDMEVESLRQIQENMERAFLFGERSPVFAIDVSRIPNNMTPKEFIKEWRKDNGIIIYRANGTVNKCIPADISKVRILK